ncbi:helix-hairpin-helix domain-containing protein [Methanofollis ethanolicus]|uniref:helix-hairpin-helix domain-containing protein n=1 Tax=Methanofollis ethanolicus TaxID=488124 RepID=UPI0009FA58C6|nr:helix-hairpin-helix domain-containing protein [Methanofollis ethanolicus]
MERQGVITPPAERYPGSDLDTPDTAGGCGRLLKVLLNARCSYDCAYCGVRTGTGECSAAPAEIADAFLRMHREGRADGLFLSSGIAGDVDTAMEGIVETGEVLRRRGFQGYLHLKVLPGAARADIADAARVADRISINIEAPSASRLSEVAGVKDYRCDIEKRQAWVAEAMPGRHTTQLVVGAAGESDAEILSCVARQYGRLAPARVYYSAFTPVAGTPLACREATPLWRQRRLYQMDALVHLYHISPDLLRDVMDDDGFLPDADPKRVLAEDLPPVDINTAPLADLLRVPGIGPVGARRICAARRTAPLVSPADLRRCGVRMKDAGPFVRFGREVQATLSSF